MAETILKRTSAASVSYGSGSVADALTKLENGLNGLKIVASERKQYTLLASGAVNISGDYPSSTNVLLTAIPVSSIYPNGLYAYITMLGANYWLKVYNAQNDSALGAETIDVYITYLKVNS